MIVYWKPLSNADATASAIFIMTFAATKEAKGLAAFIATQPWQETALAPKPWLDATTRAGNEWPLDERVPSQRRPNLCSCVFVVLRGKIITKIVE